MRRQLLIALLCSTFNLFTFANENNISVNPAGLILGVTNISYDRAISSSTTLGFEFATIDADEQGFTKQKGEQFGIRGRYHINGALKDGWLIGTSIGYIKTEVTREFSTCFPSCSTNRTTAETKGYYLSFLPTYMWMWNTFNLTLGLGVIHYNVETTVTSGTLSLDVPLDGTVPALDFSLGMAF